MKKVRQIIASPAVTLGAFALAVCLLAFSAVGGTRAALTYFSDAYNASIQLQEMGVTLMENNVAVASGNAMLSAQGGAENAALLQNLTAEGEPVKLGAVYPEELAVRNPTDTAQSGAANITEYVRVTIRRYWLRYNEAAGTWDKAPEMDSEWIRLGLLTGDNGWAIDEEAATAERTVLYYTLPLEPGAMTPLFADTLCIDPAVGVTVTRTEETTADGTVIRNTYAYDKTAFQIDIQVDAVQNHNAADAILSAWGRSVTVNADKTLSLQ